MAAYREYRLQSHLGSTCQRCVSSLPPSSLGLVLPESPPRAAGAHEREGLVGAGPGADGAPAASGGGQPEGGERLAGRPRRPGVRPAGVSAAHEPGPAEGQYTQYQGHEENIY